jgi:hypothetical protein
MGDQTQIQGVPAGVTLEPVPQNNSQPSRVTGVPPGVTLEPVSTTRPVSKPGAPLTESEAANSNYATNQSKTAVPMETSTLGSVYHSLEKGNETSADPRAHAAAEYGKRVQAGLDAANRGEITASGVGLGAVKGGLETAHTVGRVANAATGDSISALPTSFQEPKSLEAANTSEKIGKVGENILEFMAGDEALKSLGVGAKFTKLGKIASLLEEHPLLAKAVEIGGNVIRTGTVTGSQTLAHGGTPEEALESGAVGGVAGEAVGEAVPFVARKLGGVLEKYAPDFVNSLLKTKKGSFLYGKNPGQAIIDESLNAPKSLTLAGQLENLHGQLETAGENLDSQIKQALSDPKVAAKKQDVVPTIHNTIEAAKQNVVGQTGIDTKAYLEELNKLEDNILTKYDTDGNVIGNVKGARLSPAEISDVKKSIGKSTQWKINPTDPQYQIKSYVNNTRRQIYGQLADAVEQAAPEVGALNRRYANVIEAQGLLENRIAQEHGTGGFTAALRKGEWATGLGAILSGHPYVGVPLLANRVARSVPGRVLESKGASAAGKAMQAPVVKDIFEGTKPFVGTGVRVLLSTGHEAEVHPEELEELQKRDPGAKVLSEENQ